MREMKKYIPSGYRIHIEEIYTEVTPRADDKTIEKRPSILELDRIVYYETEMHQAIKDYFKEAAHAN
jgi:hypothetical protein